MKYQLLFTYQSWIPPKGDDLQKLIKLALKTLLGNVRTHELNHYGLNSAQWVIPIEVTTGGSATVDEIENAIRTIEGAAEVRLFEVKVCHSEAPGNLGPGSLSPGGGLTVSPSPGIKGGNRK